MEPWPRLWQNLRSSRETELAHEWPLHHVCAWIGNSPSVATRHYLQITDADYERASGCDANTLHQGGVMDIPEQGKAPASRITPQWGSMPLKSGPGGIRTPDQAIMSRLL